MPRLRRPPGLRRAALPRRVARELALGRVVFLVALFLLPVQMRAGTHDAHPHALLQLLIDAGDGALDHHAHEPGVAPDEQGLARPSDLPEFAASNLAGGIAMLAALVVAFVVPGPASARTWPVQSPWYGIRPLLEPPPPRTALS